MNVMEMHLEVVPLQVAEIERALRFYRDQFGFSVDLDIDVGPGGRRVQLTPPGSGCSIHITPVRDGGSACALEGLILVVADIDAARAGLAGRGVDVSSVRHMEDGAWVEGKGGRWNAFVHITDPDGNLWMLQERPAGE
jgi:catechol 2,3-dioxygenase-like lactoylglutathione lyase family enzyme